jgi:hypothetical protein
MGFNIGIKKGSQGLIWQELTDHVINASDKAKGASLTDSRQTLNALIGGDMVNA